MKTMSLLSLLLAQSVFASGEINFERLSIPSAKLALGKNITLNREEPSFVSSHLLVHPLKQTEVYQECARTLADANAIAEKLVKYQIYDPAVAEFKGSKVKREKLYRDRKAEGYGQEVLSSIEQNDKYYDLVLVNKVTTYFQHFILYKCQFYEPARKMPKGSNTVGSNFSGIVGKTTINKTTAEQEALDFVKFMERGRDVFRVKVSLQASGFQLNTKRQ